MEHPLQQQLTQGGIETTQTVTHPALRLGFTAEGVPLVVGAAGIRPLAGREPIQQRAAPLIPIGSGSVEAAQPQSLVQLHRLTPALRRAAQGRRKLLLPQRRQLAMLTLLLQGLATPVQLAQLAGAAQRLLVIAQVVLHRPADVGHREAAQSSGARWIKGLDRTDQPKAAQLHQILEWQAGARAHASSHLAHQGQVQLHQPVAQPVVSTAVKALKQVGIAAVEVLVLVRLGAWIWHGGDSGGSVVPPSAELPWPRFTPTGEQSSPRWVIGPAVSVGRRAGQARLQTRPGQQGRPLAHLLIHPAMAVGIEMQAIGAQQPTPVGIIQQRLQQRQEGHIGLQAGLLKQALVLAHRGQLIPEATGEGHRRLIHRRQPQHQHRSQPHRLPQQLLQAEEESLRRQLVAPIGTTDPGRVVQTDADHNALGGLTAQLTPAAHLPMQAGRQPLQSIAANPEVVEHGPFGQTHPVAPQPLAPAAAIGIPQP